MKLIHHLLKPLLGCLLGLWFTISVAAPLDINTATAAELATVMQNVGPKKAEAIVAWREQNGPFKSVDELEKVPGIGPKIVEANRDRLTVDTPAAAATPAPAMPAPAAAAAAPAAPAAPLKKP